MDTSGPEEKKSLLDWLSNRARKAARIGNRFLVPRVLDNQGAPLAPEQIGASDYLWDFSLREVRFLKAMQVADNDFDKAVQETGVESAWAKKFLERKSAVAFRTEAGHIQALAEVADATWVKGKYVSAALGESSPDDTQRWAIDRLKDIVIPKQLANLKIETNVYQMPVMTPEQAKALKELADKMADVEETSLA